MYNYYSGYTVAQRVVTKDYYADQTYNGRIRIGLRQSGRIVLRLLCREMWARKELQDYLDGFQDNNPLTDELTQKLEQKVDYDPLPF